MHAGLPHNCSSKHPLCLPTLLQTNKLPHHQPHTCNLCIISCSMSVANAQATKASTLEFHRLLYSYHRIVLLQCANGNCHGCCNCWWCYLRHCCHRCLYFCGERRYFHASVVPAAAAKAVATAATASATASANATADNTLTTASTAPFFCCCYQ